MVTVAIIGGHQEQTFKQLARKRNIEVLFHDGKTGGGSVIKQFRPIIRKADAVVILKGAVSHVSMWKVRKLANEMRKPIFYMDGMGASRALRCIEELIKMKRGA